MNALMAALTFSANLHVLRFHHISTTCKGHELKVD